MATLDQGTVFGEKGIDEGNPRNATIVCSTHCHFGVINKRDYIEILRDVSKIEAEQRRSYIVNKVFKRAVSDSLASRLAYDFFKFETDYNAKEVIFLQGTRPEFVYILKKGEVIISRTEMMSTKDTKCELMVERKMTQNFDLAIIKEGEIFGDYFLLNQSDRFFTATTSMESTILKVSVECLFGHLKVHSGVYHYLYKRAQQKVLYRLEILGRKMKRQQNVIHRLNQDDIREIDGGLITKLIRSPEDEHSDEIYMDFEDKVSQVDEFNQKFVENNRKFLDRDKVLEVKKNDGRANEVRVGQFKHPDSRISTTLKQQTLDSGYTLKGDYLTTKQTQTHNSNQLTSPLHQKSLQTRDKKQTPKRRKIIKKRSKRATPAHNPFKRFPKQLSISSCIDSELLKQKGIFIGREYRNQRKKQSFDDLFEGSRPTKFKIYSKSKRKELKKITEERFGIKPRKAVSCIAKDLVKTNPSPENKNHLKRLNRSVTHENRYESLMLSFGESVYGDTTRFKRLLEEKSSMKAVEQINELKWLKKHHREMRVNKFGLKRKRLRMSNGARHSLFRRGSPKSRVRSQKVYEVWMDESLADYDSVPRISNFDFILGVNSLNGYGNSMRIKFHFSL